MNSLESLLAIITLVPALAWFVNAFGNLYKMSQEHKEEIKKVASDVKETVEEKATEIKEKIESHKKKKDAPSPSEEIDSTQS